MGLRKTNKVAPLSAIDLEFYKNVMLINIKFVFIARALV